MQLKAEVGLWPRPEVSISLAAGGFFRKRRALAAWPGVEAERSALCAAKQKRRASGSAGAVRTKSLRGPGACFWPPGLKQSFGHLIKNRI